MIRVLYSEAGEFSSAREVERLGVHRATGRWILREIGPALRGIFLAEWRKVWRRAR